jgi:hypothetical protein
MLAATGSQIMRSLASPASDVPGWRSQRAAAKFLGRTRESAERPRENKSNFNAVEIEEAISALAEQALDAHEFPFAFLASACP